MSFARCTASASVQNVETLTTGPNTSSCSSSASAGNPASTVGG